MYELSVSVDFSAAHKLRGHKGKCARLHGHNWRVEALVRSAALDKLGMVMDAGDVKTILRDFLETDLDHAFLNDIPFFKKNNPTSENIAVFIYAGMKKKIPGLAEVRVSESGSVAVAYRQK